MGTATLFDLIAEHTQTIKEIIELWRMMSTQVSTLVGASQPDLDHFKSTIKTEVYMEMNAALVPL